MERAEREVLIPLRGVSAGRASHPRYDNTRGEEPLPHSPPELEAVGEAFQRAVAGQPRAPHEAVYQFGCRGVRMRVVGQWLFEHVAHAFAHLATGSLTADDAQLTIELWDERETGVSYPDVASDDGGARVWKIGGGTVTGYPGGRVFRYEQAGAITWLDRRTSRIVGWCAAGEHLSIDARAKPLALLLHIWYFDRDIHVVHAGLIARSGQGILVGGRNGTGKTTTTLACLSAGFDYLGDDQIGVSVGEGGRLLGHSLYNGTRIAPEHAARFPFLAAHTFPGEQPRTTKLLVLISEVAPERVQRMAEIRAIALPRIVTGDASRVHRAAKPEAFRRLAPTGVFTPFGPGAQGVQRLAELVERVPAYWLEIGADLRQIPQGVEQILTEAIRS